MFFAPKTFLGVRRRKF